MVDTYVDYAGLELSNPIIVASSNITATLKRIKKAQDNGAGAVVMKSLIEQAPKIINPRFKLINNGLSLYSYESSDWNHEKYTQEIVKAKKELKIPIIASIACVNDKVWVENARFVEEAGADALELNLSCPLKHPSNEDVSDKAVHILKLVKDKISIPVIPKLTPQLTNPLIVAHKLEKAGADAIVMFNRFIGLEIDIKKEEPVLFDSYCGYGGQWSVNYSLRWISEAHTVLNIPISGSSGIRFPSDVVKYILAGATTVQICTAILTKGYSAIKEFNEGLKEFMIEKGYTKLTEFKGKVASNIIPIKDIHVNKKVKVHIKDDKCNKCNLCRNVCVNESINGNYQVMPSCDSCGLCVELCPNKAISLIA